jgi:hypothetical protein
VRAFSRAVTVAGAVAVLGACSQGPAPQPARLWTIADVQALAASGGTAVATGSSLPGGIPLSRILFDNALVRRPTLADSYSATYVTTEVWVGYDQVWVQPMYVPVSGWVNGTPQVITDGAGARKPIFSVGPGSGFYSPFWQAMYFDAPAGTTADTYRSVRQILGAGLAIHEGEGWTIPLVPPDLAWGFPAAVAGSGWLDGGVVADLDFGRGLFTWNPDTDVVGELPLFVFVTRNDQGQWVVPPFPTVAGTGPVGSGGPAPVKVGTQPLYSSYWRIYTVEVPAGAAVVADDGLQAELAADGLPPAPAVDPAMLAASPTALGRIAINPACFARDIAPDDKVCTYLDSQLNIELNVAAAAIRRTDVTVTSPFVTYKDGLAVVRLP